jgi:cell wall assembly regulator SMI1
VNSTVEKAWARLWRWYEENLPVNVYRFLGGATLDEIRAFEDKIDVVLAEEVRESFLLCNGSEGCGLSFFGNINPLSEMLSIWNAWQGYIRQGPDWPPFPETLPPGIKRAWSRARIPISDNMDGNYVVGDMDPTETGIAGQVFSLIAQKDQ